jgi:hypothetical protein
MKTLYWYLQFRFWAWRTGCKGFNCTTNGSCPRWKIYKLAVKCMTTLPSRESVEQEIGRTDKITDSYQNEDSENTQSEQR